MLPDQPWLVMCPHCRAPLWIDELEKLGQVDPWDEDGGRLSDARICETPSPADYFALLNKGIAEPNRERYARLRLWWTENDRRRNQAGELLMSSREVMNLTAIAQKLDESIASDLVMKAEAMRELGRFDDALALLAKVSDENLAQAVEIIRTLSAKKDPYVRQMNFR